ncbi:MAG TPA: zinc ribbon domain-containing protein [Caldilineae bacterium]|jgi:putative FmdB family regulatory protein|nr:zinc ribbon domain-containing protein [Caldilineae bacterium]
MPLYEYRCAACGHRFDHWFATFQAAEEEEDSLACPTCGSSSVSRLFSRVAIHVAGEASDSDDSSESKEEEPVEEKPKVFGRKELNEIMEMRKSWGID